MDLEDTQKLKRKWLNTNWVLLLSTLSLVTLGILFVKSACSTRESEVLRMLWVGQLEFAVLGFIFMCLIALTDYRQWIKLSGIIYLIMLTTLILVLMPGIGQAQMGARRWLFGLQPSEPAKLGVILLVASILGRLKEHQRSFKTLLKIGILTGIPAVLILCEPDLGTALVLGPTVLSMLFLARIAPKTLGIATLLICLVVAYELTIVSIAKDEATPPERSEQLLKWTGLRDHQVRRVETFLFPDRDPFGDGYNARQSEIAVGSGGAWGKGYGQGIQHRMGYLPAKVSVNDFIFPVIAEELGYAGSLFLISLYGFGIFLPGLIIAIRCKDDTGKLLALGIVFLLFCHIFINIGMTVRIVPITGLPLPFISQGGTFMLVMMMAMGVLQSVAIHGRSTEHVFRR
ncbi:MAG: FtsW/RodA/SpoVE family cell cycle protein [bacterium]|nr:FtsW/RodA/SpoVE family cell cycle protein [bacterium]